MNRKTHTKFSETIYLCAFFNFPLALNSPLPCNFDSGLPLFPRFCHNQLSIGKFL